MEIYGAQLEPFLDLLLNKPTDAWDPQSSSPYERALARAEISRRLEGQAS
jgi:hypothetical protein